MGKFNQQVVCITGASAGLGAAMASAFADEGADLVLLARRLDRLEAVATPLRTAGRRVWTFRCDVTQPQELVNVVSALDQQGVVINVLVANAGFGVKGQVQDLTVEDYRLQMDANVFGVLQSFAAFKSQLQSTRGRLVLIGSVAGYIAQPGAAAYAMSKFALRGWSEAARVDLREIGIGVTLISPGLLATDFRRVDNANRFHAQAQDPYAMRSCVAAEQAARSVVRATYLGKREQIISLQGRLLMAVQRFCPWLLRWVFRYGGKAHAPIAESQSS